MNANLHQESMRIDFPQGVPDGCTEWLKEHVGSGVDNANGVGFDECAWYYVA